MNEQFEFKSAANGQISLDQAEGIVECFVAGIGNKDSVGDIVVTGAFAKSLTRRKPRVVWAHSWNDPIGKVLEMYEVPPGDPRLPAKMRNAGIGGLYAKVQFNLQSEKGKEAFASVAFFGEEQEWSIGYKTITGAFDPAQQANVLKEVELYEVSPVLHGANQLTGTISVKSEQKNHMMPVIAGMPMMGEQQQPRMIVIAAPEKEQEQDEPFNIFAEGLAQPLEADKVQKIQAELSERTGSKVDIVEATDSFIVFRRTTTDGKVSMYRVGYHTPDGYNTFMFGKPEAYSGNDNKPQMQQEIEVKPADTSMVPMQPQQIPYRDDDQDEMNTMLGGQVGVGKSAYAHLIEIPQIHMVQAKSMLQPVFNYHKLSTTDSDNGIIVNGSISAQAIDALQNAVKAIGQTIGQSVGNLRTLAQSFNPYAIDGDNDGFAQDGTAFQRPYIPIKRPDTDLPEVGGKKRNSSELLDKPTIRTGKKPTKDPSLLQGQERQEALAAGELQPRTMDDISFLANRRPENEGIAKYWDMSEEGLRAEGQKLVAARRGQTGSAREATDGELFKISHEFSRREAYKNQFGKEFVPPKRTESTGRETFDYRDLEATDEMIRPAGREFTGYNPFIERDKEKQRIAKLAEEAIAEYEKGRSKRGFASRGDVTPEQQNRIDASRKRGADIASGRAQILADNLKNLSDEDKDTIREEGIVSFLLQDGTGGPLSGEWAGDSPAERIGDLLPEGDWSTDSGLQADAEDIFASYEEGFYGQLDKEFADLVNPADLETENSRWESLSANEQDSILEEGRDSIRGLASRYDLFGNEVDDSAAVEERVNKKRVRELQEEFGWDRDEAEAALNNWDELDGVDADEFDKEAGGDINAAIYNAWDTAQTNRENSRGFRSRGETASEGQRPPRTAVAMQMDPKNSKLARQIDYDPQNGDLTVYYRDGKKETFNDVPYDRVRKAGTDDKPDALISALQREQKKPQSRSGFASRGEGNGPWGSNMSLDPDEPELSDGYIEDYVHDYVFEGGNFDFEDLVKYNRRKIVSDEELQKLYDDYLSDDTKISDEAADTIERTFFNEIVDDRYDAMLEYYLSRFDYRDEDDGFASRGAPSLQKPTPVEELEDFKNFLDREYGDYFMDYTQMDDEELKKTLMKRYAMTRSEANATTRQIRKHENKLDDLTDAMVAAEDAGFASRGLDVPGKNNDLGRWLPEDVEEFLNSNDDLLGELDEQYYLDNPGSPRPGARDHSSEAMIEDLMANPEKYGFAKDFRKEAIEALKANGADRDEAERVADYWIENDGIHDEYLKQADGDSLYAMALAYDNWLDASLDDYNERQRGFGSSGRERGFASFRDGMYDPDSDPYFDFDDREPDYDATSDDEWDNIPEKVQTEIINDIKEYLEKRDESAADNVALQIDDERGLDITDDSFILEIDGIEHVATPVVKGEDLFKQLIEDGRRTGGKQNSTKERLIKSLDDWSALVSRALDNGAFTKEEADGYNEEINKIKSIVNNPQANFFDELLSSQKKLEQLERNATERTREINQGDYNKTRSGHLSVLEALYSANHYGELRNLKDSWAELRYTGQVSKDGKYQITKLEDFAKDAINGELEYEVEDDGATSVRPQWTWWGDFEKFADGKNKFVQENQDLMRPYFRNGFASRGDEIPEMRPYDDLTSKEKSDLYETIQDYLNGRGDWARIKNELEEGGFDYDDFLEQNPEFHPDFADFGDAGDMGFGSRGSSQDVELDEYGFGPAFDINKNDDWQMSRFDEIDRQSQQDFVAELEADDYFADGDYDDTDKLSLAADEWNGRGLETRERYTDEMLGELYELENIAETFTNTERNGTDFEGSAFAYVEELIKNPMSSDFSDYEEARKTMDGIRTSLRRDVIDRDKSGGDDESGFASRGSKPPSAATLQELISDRLGARREDDSRIPKPLRDYSKALLENWNSLTPAQKNEVFADTENSERGNLSAEDFLEVLESAWQSHAYKNEKFSALDDELRYIMEDNDMSGFASRGGSGSRTVEDFENLGYTYGASFFEDTDLYERASELGKAKGELTTAIDEAENMLDGLDEDSPEWERLFNAQQEMSFRLGEVEDMMEEMVTEKDRLDDAMGLAATLTGEADELVETRRGITRPSAEDLDELSFEDANFEYTSLMRDINYLVDENDLSVDWSEEKQSEIEKALRDGDYEKAEDMLYDVTQEIWDAADDKYRTAEAEYDDYPFLDEDNGFASRGGSRFDTMETPYSSAIEAVHYDRNTRELHVAFKPGQTGGEARYYTYSGVSPDYFDNEISGSSSIGRVINDVKKNYDVEVTNPKTVDAINGRGEVASAPGKLGPWSETRSRLNGSIVAEGDDYYYRVTPTADGTGRYTTSAMSKRSYSEVDRMPTPQPLEQAKAWADRHYRENTRATTPVGGRSEIQDIDVRRSAALYESYYDPNAEELVVTFKDKDGNAAGSYIYEGVTADEANELASASSKGKVINRLKASKSVRRAGADDRMERTPGAADEVGAGGYEAQVDSHWDKIGPDEQRAYFARAVDSAINAGTGTSADEITADAKARAYDDRQIAMMEMQAEKLGMGYRKIDVGSSAALNRVEYDPDKRELRVEYRGRDGKGNGEFYVYQNVPQSVVDDIEASDSRGATLRRVRDDFEFRTESAIPESAFYSMGDAGDMGERSNPKITNRTNANGFYLDENGRATNYNKRSYTTADIQKINGRRNGRDGFASMGQELQDLQSKIQIDLKNPGSRNGKRNKPIDPDVAANLANPESDAGTLVYPSTNEGDYIRISYNPEKRKYSVERIQTVRGFNRDEPPEEVVVDTADADTSYEAGSLVREFAENYVNELRLENDNDRRSATYGSTFGRGGDADDGFASRGSINESSTGQRIVPSRMHSDDREALAEITDPEERKQRIDELIEFYGPRIFAKPSKPKRKKIVLTQDENGYWVDQDGKPSDFNFTDDGFASRSWSSKMNRGYPYYFFDEDELGEQSGFGGAIQRADYSTDNPEYEPSLMIMPWNSLSESRKKLMSDSILKKNREYFDKMWQDGASLGEIEKEIGKLHDEKAKAELISLERTLKMAKEDFYDSARRRLEKANPSMSQNEIDDMLVDMGLSETDFDNLFTKNMDAFELASVATDLEKKRREIVAISTPKTGGDRPKVDPLSILGGYSDGDVFGLTPRGFASRGESGVKKKTKEDVFADMQKQLIDALEDPENLGKWKLPWRRTGMPENGSTGKKYSGSNWFFLSVMSDIKGYDSNKWATYNQWQGLGGQVRKGEKGTQIFVPMFVKGKEKADGTMGEGRIMFKAATVFNLKQIDGMPADFDKKEILPEAERVSDLEKTISEIPAVIKNGGDRAFFQPSGDFIQVPNFENFNDARSYYSTVAHELMHWTGGKGRLDRGQMGAFGTPEYAYEELVAEIASAIFMSSHDIEPDIQENHGPYLASWLKALKQDPDALQRAMTDAQKAVNYVLDISPNAKSKFSHGEKAEFDTPEIAVVGEPVVAVEGFASRGDWPTPGGYEPSEFDMRTALSQIGRGNLMAISGTRAKKRNNEMVLPVNRNQQVIVGYDGGSDTYFVRAEQIITNGKDKGKTRVLGQWDNVYADELGETAYQASLKPSMLSDENKTVWAQAFDHPQTGSLLDENGQVYENGLASGGDSMDPDELDAMDWAYDAAQDYLMEQEDMMPEEPSPEDGFASRMNLSTPEKNEIISIARGMNTPFTRSVVAQYDRNGELSDRQWDALNRMTLRGNRSGFPSRGGDKRPRTPKARWSPEDRQRYADGDRLRSKKRPGKRRNGPDASEYGFGSRGADNRPSIDMIESDIFFEGERNGRSWGFEPIISIVAEQFGGRKNMSNRQLAKELGVSEAVAEKMRKPGARTSDIYLLDDLRVRVAGSDRSIWGPNNDPLAYYDESGKPITDYDKIPDVEDLAPDAPGTRAPKEGGARTYIDPTAVFEEVGIDANASKYSIVRDNSDVFNRRVWDRIMTRGITEDEINALLKAKKSSKRSTDIYTPEQLGVVKQKRTDSMPLADIFKNQAFDSLRGKRGFPQQVAEAITEITGRRPAISTVKAFINQPRSSGSQTGRNPFAMTPAQIRLLLDNLGISAEEFEKFRSE